MSFKRWPLVSAGLLLWALCVGAYGTSLQAVEQEWEQLVTATKKERAVKLETLVQQLDAWVDAEPNSVPALVWQGTALESLAREVGGFTGLRYAKQAYVALNRAIELDPQGYDGMAQVRLGLLYERAPGWPVAFGSLKAAEENYLAALAIRPDGVDTNFYYATYLNFLGRKKEAMEYAKRALEGSPRIAYQEFEQSLQQQAKDMVGEKEEE